MAVKQQKPWRKWFDGKGGYLGEGSGRTGLDKVPPVPAAFEPSKGSQPLYAKEWHKCIRCGCFWPERPLAGSLKTPPENGIKRVHRQDPLLKIDEHVWLCTDERLCAVYKDFRDKVLARETNGLMRDISKKPIRSRK